MPRKGVTLAEAIQLAHARPSCTSLGRVSQDSSHQACQRASPTIFAVSFVRVLHHVARKRKRITVPNSSWARTQCGSSTREKRQVHHPEKTQCSGFTLESPQTRSKFCRAEGLGILLGPRRCAKALVRTKSRHSRDPARAKHVRRAKAEIRTTRANYYGCNSQAAERTKTARLASPLGIPPGPATDATRRGLGGQT